MPIGVPLKIVVAASVVLVLGLLVAAAAPVGIQPNAPGEIVVGRYNQMRTGVATDVGHITTPSVLWTFQTTGTIATSPLAADVDGDGELEVFLGEYKPGGAADGSRLGYVLDAHGKAQYTIPMRYNGAAAAAADLDGDPGVELVFSEGCTPTRMAASGTGCSMGRTARPSGVSKPAMTRGRASSPRRRSLMLMGTGSSIWSQAQWTTRCRRSAAW